MKLWLLRPKKLPIGDDPWDPWYDKCFGFVIRADNEVEARALATEHAGDEKRGEFLSETIANTKTPWLDAKYSSCEILEANGEAGLIIQDFHAA